MVALSLSSPASTAGDAGASAARPTATKAPQNVTSDGSGVAADSVPVGPDRANKQTDSNFAAKLRESLATIAANVSDEIVPADGTRPIAVPLNELLPTITAALQAQDGEAPTDDVRPLETLPPNVIAAIAVLAKANNSPSLPEQVPLAEFRDGEGDLIASATALTDAIADVLQSTGVIAKAVVETDEPAAALVEFNLDLTPDQGLVAESTQDAHADLLPAIPDPATQPTRPNEVSAALDVIAATVRPADQGRARVGTSDVVQNQSNERPVLPVAAVSTPPINSEAIEQRPGLVDPPAAKVDRSLEHAPATERPAIAQEVAGSSEINPALKASPAALATPAEPPRSANRSTAAEPIVGGENPDVARLSPVSVAVDAESTSPSSPAESTQDTDVATPGPEKSASSAKLDVEVGPASVPAVVDPALPQANFVERTIRQAASPAESPASAVTTPAAANAAAQSIERPGGQQRSRPVDRAELPERPTATHSPVEAVSESEPSPVAAPVAWTRAEPVPQASTSDIPPTATAAVTVSQTPAAPVVAATNGPVLEADTSNAQAVKVATQLTTAVEQAIETNARPLRMRLDPPELGSIAVEIRRDGGQVQIEVQFESARALKLASEGVEAFRESLIAKGFDVDADQIRLQLEIGRDAKVTDAAATSNNESPRDQDAQQRDRQERERSEAGQNGADRQQRDASGQQRRGDSDDRRPAPFAAPRPVAEPAQSVSPRHEVDSGSIDVQV